MMGGARTRRDGPIVAALSCALLILVAPGASVLASRIDQEPSRGATQAPMAGTITTPAVGDTVRPQALQWTRLTCPVGEYVVGFSIRQGGWLSRIGVQCAAPTATGDWASKPVAGGVAGGEYGSHSAHLICPRGRWVMGISGLKVRIEHMRGVVEGWFFADPVIACGALHVPGYTYVRDPRFEPEEASRFDLTPARYADSPAAYCAPGRSAVAAEAALQPRHRPDVKAVRLLCATLPGGRDRER